MKGKRRITALASIFMAVILCLTSAVPVPALETGNEILLNQGNGSETGSLIQADDAQNITADITSDDISEDVLNDISNNASDNTSDNTSEISLYSTQDYADTDNVPENREADDDKTPAADTDGKEVKADGVEAGNADKEAKAGGKEKENSGTSAADNETSANEEESGELRDIVRINPLYEDVVDESDIPLPPEESTWQTQGTNSAFGTAQTYKSGAPAYKSASVDTYNATSAGTYTTISDAAAYLRDCMEAHESEVRININIPSIDYGNDLDALWDMVLAQAKTHSGKGTQGDSISYQYAGARGQYSSKILIYYPGYYTTKEQENELTARVSEVLKSLKLDGCSDEVKSARIHKYITDHVVYDHANLNNVNYKLKYTAYAALINGTAVCQGYSVLFYRMALDAGLDARVISGKGNGGDHAWNIVRLNGKYYNLDSTWDAGKSPATYGYYLNNKTFDNSHVRASKSNSGLDYTSASFNRQYPMASSSLPYPESEKKHPTSVKFVQGTTVTAGLGSEVTLDVSVEPADAWDKYVSFTILSGATIGCSWKYNDKTDYVTVVPSGKASGSVTVRATTRDGNKTCDCKIVFRENTTPLAITKHPSNASGKAGDKVSFNITATGEGIKYLWQCSEDNGSTYKNLNSVWEGYNTASLKVPVTAARNGFKYRCAVTDVTGASIYSNPATLTVTEETGGGTVDPFVQTEITVDSGQPGYLTQGYSMEVTGSVTGTNRDIVFTKVKGDGINISKQSSDAGRFRLRIDASGCKVASGDSVEAVVKATVKNGKKDGNGKYTDYVNDSFYTVRVYPGSTLTFAPDTRKFSYTSPASVNTGTTGGRDNSAIDKDNQITAFTDCKGVFIKVWENEVKDEPVWSSSIAAKGGNSAVISGDSLVTALRNAGKLSTSSDFIFRIYPCNSNGKYNKNVYSDATIHIYRISVTGTGVVPASFYGLKGQEIEIKASPADAASLNWSDSSYWADDAAKKEGQLRKVTVTGDKTYTAVLSPVTVDVTKVTINRRDGSDVIKLETGKSRQLSATVEPSNATDKSVGWKSSNTDIVKIDSKGNITGVKEGEAVITVTTNSRGLTDICTVKVMDEVIEDDYVIEGQEVRMTANIPDGSSVKNGAKISLSCDPAAALVYYTLDGTAPVGDYAGKNGRGTSRYSEPVTINGANGDKVTVRARAVLYGYKSCEAAFSYIVDDWGEIDDEGDDIKEKIPDSDPEKIPKAVWYSFKGDNKIYLPNSTPQTVSVNKIATGKNIIFNNEISVFYGNEKLVEGRDYRVIYSNNVSPADASSFAPPTVMIKSMGSYYKGNSRFCFTISEAGEQTDVSDIKIACLNRSPEYTGSRLTLDDLYMPDSKMGYNKVTLYRDSQGANGSERKVLIRDVDYTFDESQLRKEGTFNLQFELTGDKGTVISDPITVRPYDVAKHIKNNDSKVVISVEKQVEYNKSGARPDVKVAFRNSEGESVLREGVDYTVAYSKNKKLNSRAKVKIRFMGYFSGVVKDYFEIVKKNVSELKVYAENVKGNGKPGGFKVMPKVFDGGKSVSRLKDIMKYSQAEDCRYFYASGSSDIIGKEIADNAIVMPGDMGQKIEVRVRIKGRDRGAYSGEAELSGYYWVYPADKDIKKMQVSPGTIIVDYDEGNEIYPISGVDFKLMIPDKNDPDKKEELSPKYYEIVSITQNRFIGTATVVVRGRNGYGGSKSFRIKIKKRSLNG